jgi:hypothetical protein
MKSFFILALSSLVVVSCAAPETPAASATSTASTMDTAAVPTASTVAVVVPLERGRFFESAIIGGAVGNDGNVHTELTTFRKGQPIYVTVRAREVPVGLAARAVWFDPKNKEISMESKPVPVDAKVVTFQAPSTRRWQTGKHRVEIWLGGDQVVDQEIEIRK